MIYKNVDIASENEVYNVQTVLFVFYAPYYLVIACMVLIETEARLQRQDCIGTCLCPSSVGIIKNLQFVITLVLAIAMCFESLMDTSKSPIHPHLFTYTCLDFRPTLRWELPSRITLSLGTTLRKNMPTQYASCYPRTYNMMSRLLFYKCPQPREILELHNIHLHIYINAHMT